MKLKSGKRTLERLTLGEVKRLTKENKIEQVSNPLLFTLDGYKAKSFELGMQEDRFKQKRRIPNEANAYLLGEQLHFNTGMGYTCHFPVIFYKVSE